MLKLDGKPFTTKVTSAAATKIKEFLQAAPEDEIYSRAEMNSRGFSKDSLDKAVVAFPELSRLWKGKRFYGSLKALEAFDKEIA